MAAAAFGCGAVTVLAGAAGFVTVTGGAVTVTSAPGSPGMLTVTVGAGLDETARASGSPPAPTVRPTANTPSPARTIQPIRASRLIGFFGGFGGFGAGWNCGPPSNGGRGGYCGPSLLMTGSP